MVRTRRSSESRQRPQRGESPRMRTSTTASRTTSWTACSRPRMATSVHRQIAVMISKPLGIHRGRQEVDLGGECDVQTDVERTATAPARDGVGGERQHHGAHQGTDQPHHVDAAALVRHVGGGADEQVVQRRDSGQRRWRSSGAGSWWATVPSTRRGRWRAGANRSGRSPSSRGTSVR